MKKNEGFTLIEVLVAMSIVMMLVATIIPINILIKQERKILEDKRTISMRLHDELQKIVFEDMKPQNDTVEIGNKSVYFTFRTEQELQKGCAIWENEKQKEETICLYGLKE